MYVGKLEGKRHFREECIEDLQRLAVLFYFVALDNGCYLHSMQTVLLQVMLASTSLPAYLSKPYV